MGADRIVGMHDALQHEVALPQLAVALDVLPGHRRAVLVADEIGDLLGVGAGPGVLRPIVEVRRAVLHPFHHPGRMQQRLELGLPGELERPAPAVARVALAVGAFGHVDREDQRLQAGIAGALDHVLGDRLVLGGVELVPAMVGGELAESLDRAGARARHDEGHVGVARRLGQHQVGAAAEQAGEAGRRDADGAGIGPAEQRRRLVAHRHVDQVARHDARLAEGLLVGDQPDLVVGAALDEVIGDLGQPLLGELAQIVDVDHALHCFSLPLRPILPVFAALCQRVGRAAMQIRHAKPGDARVLRTWFLSAAKTVSDASAACAPPRPSPSGAPLRADRAAPARRLLSDMQAHYGSPDPPGGARKWRVC